MKKMAQERGTSRHRLYNMSLLETVQGEVVLTKKMIEEAIEEHKTIKRYAVIYHDKDVYHKFDAPYLVDAEGNYVLTETKKKDEKPQKIRDMMYVHVSEGGKSDVYLQKAPHFHIVLDLGGTAVSQVRVAQWFNTKWNFARPAKGRGAFLECVRYLTHEDEAQQALGKHLYPDNAIYSNFDFRSEIDAMEREKATYGGSSLSLEDELRFNVLQKGTTVRSIIQTDDIEIKLLFAKRPGLIQELYKLRSAYLMSQTPPNSRINYYMSGGGGAGKGLLARALARSLYPDLSDDRDIFFEVGAAGNLFDQYDGQPVLLWNDYRSDELLKALGKRGNVFNVFESHPTAQLQNVKYSTTMLLNTVNIVNSVEPVMDFFSNLAGDEDPNQVYRRFPVPIIIGADYYQMFVSQGFLDGSKDYADYVSNARMRQSLQAAISAGGRTEEYKLEELATVQPIVENHQKLLEVKGGTFEPVGGQMLDSECVSLFGEVDGPKDNKAKPEQTRLPLNDGDMPF